MTLRLSISAEPITEDWLKTVGFKWHKLERQTHKHWLLWLGPAIKDAAFEDLGIELTPAWWTNRLGEKVGRDDWFCWLRADTSHRYSRFLHVRHLKYRHEVETLVTALTGLPWNPANHFYGSAHTSEGAERIRVEHERMDLRMLRQGHPWHETERDETRGRPLAEHLEAHAKSGVER